MMVELGRAKRQSIRAVCESSSEVLVRGAMEGTMGHVWVPGLENASFCLIVAGDFAYLLGLPPKGAGALDLKAQIYRCSSGCCLYPQNDQWRQWLEDEFAGQLRTVVRYALRQESGGFDRELLNSYVKSIPQGMRIRRIDERLYRLALKEEWSQDLCASFEDYKHFQTHGFGYGAMKGHRLAAGCLAYGASEGMMKVQVKTRKEYRRQGLALACSAAFVLECLEKDITPNWEATNQQSAELALKLGYVHEKEYQVYQLLEIEN